jgi:hypothetical protein
MGLPDFWKRIAMGLWPGYYSAEEDWMCAPLCIAKAVGSRKKVPVEKGSHNF